MDEAVREECDRLLEVVAECKDETKRLHDRFPTATIRGREILINKLNRADHALNVNVDAAYYYLDTIPFSQLLDRMRNVFTARDHRLYVEYFRYVDQKLHILMYDIQDIEPSIRADMPSFPELYYIKSYLDDYLIYLTSGGTGPYSIPRIRSTLSRVNGYIAEQDVYDREMAICSGAHRGLGRDSDLSRLPHDVVDKIARLSFRARD
jgi:hypothetical protein